MRRGRGTNLSFWLRKTKEEKKEHVMSACYVPMFSLFLGYHYRHGAPGGWASCIRYELDSVPEIRQIFRWFSRVIHDGYGRLSRNFVLYSCALNAQDPIRVLEFYSKATELPLQCTYRVKCKCSCDMDMTHSIFYLCTLKRTTKNAEAWIVTITVADVHGDRHYFVQCSKKLKKNCAWRIRHGTAGQMRSLRIKFLPFCYGLGVKS